MSRLERAARALLGMLGDPSAEVHDPLLDDPCVREIRAALAAQPAQAGEAVACLDCDAGHPRWVVPENGNVIHTLPGGTISPCVKAHPHPAGVAETALSCLVCGHVAPRGVWHEPSGQYACESCRRAGQAARAYRMRPVRHGPLQLRDPLDAAVGLLETFNDQNFAEAVQAFFVSKERLDKHGNLLDEPAPEPAPATLRAAWPAAPDAALAPVVVLCEKHKHFEIVPGPFCPACTHAQIIADVRGWAKYERPDAALLERVAREAGQVERPEIVCLCGSTRFMDAFREANLRLTLGGKIVLSIGCDTKSDDALGLTEADKAALDELHKRKIDLCDRVLVLNVGGYIGSSTRSEIEYATAKGKPVEYLEPIR